MKDLNINENFELVIKNSTPGLPTTEDQLKNIILKNQKFFKKEHFNKIFSLKEYNGDYILASLGIREELLGFYKSNYKNEKCIKYLDIKVICSDKIRVFYLNKQDKNIILISEMEV